MPFTRRFLRIEGKKVLSMCLQNRIFDASRYVRGALSNLLVSPVMLRFPIPCVEITRPMHEPREVDEGQQDFFNVVCGMVSALDRCATAALHESVFLSPMIPAYNIDTGKYSAGPSYRICISSVLEASTELGASPAIYALLATSDQLDGCYLRLRAEDG